MDVCIDKRVHIVHMYSTNAVRKTSGCFPWRHLSQLLAFSVKRSISLAEIGLMRFLLLNKAAGET